MSHCTPEHNRPQEGEEPEEPFPFDPPYRITTSEQEFVTQALTGGGSIKHAPTTGEWRKAGFSFIEIGNKSVAFHESEERDLCFDAHNAALAAVAQTAALIAGRAAELEEQLAAERKKVQTLRDALQKALLPIAAWKLTDETEPYKEVGPDLRKGFLDAHDSIMSTLAKVLETEQPALSGSSQKKKHNE